MPDVLLLGLLAGVWRNGDSPRTSCWGLVFVAVVHTVLALFVFDTGLADVGALLVGAVLVGLLAVNL